MAQEAAPAAPADGAPPDGNQTPTPDSGQEPRTFDEDYVKKLRGEAAGYRTELQQTRERLQQFEDRDKTDQQKIAEERDRLQAQLAEADQDRMRLRVAADKQVPADLVDLLTGSSKEDMEAVADRLLKHVQQPPDPDWDAGPRDGVPVGDMNTALRRAAGRA